MRSEKEMLELLDKYLNDARDILDSLGIEYEPVGEIGVLKNHSAFGMTVFDRRLNIYEININLSLLQSNIPYNETMNTVIHELLHCHKNRHEHRGEWKKCAQLVNENYKQFDIRAHSHGYTVRLNDPKYKYHIICKDCGHISFHQRKSKCVRDLMAGYKNWICRNCESDNLELEFYNGRKE